MAVDRDQEAMQLVLGPGFALSLASRLHDLSGHPDTGRRAAAQLTDCHRIIECGPQHHPEDLDAAAREVAT
jgi:hypothetical protein